MGGSASGDYDGSEGSYTQVDESAPWVLVISTQRAARDWLAERIREHAAAITAATAREGLELIEDRYRPSLVVVDLDDLEVEPVQLLWELARACPNAPRLLIATPGTRAHVDARAFAEVFDLLLDQPCSLGQVEVALSHLLGAVLLSPPASRWGVEIPPYVADRVDEAWRAGRVSSCWCVDLSHAKRALGSRWNDSVAEVVSNVLARTLAEVFPGLVEVLQMVPVEPAAFALIVAHASPRMDLGLYAARVEDELAVTLGPTLAGCGDGKPRPVVTAHNVRVATRSSIAPRLSAAIQAARAGSADRLRHGLDLDRACLLEVLDDGLRFSFQPIVDLASAELYAYEGLVRPTWPSSLGSVFDVAYLAGAVGLGRRFDEAVVAGALRASVDLGARQRLFVRVSPHWLCEPRQIERARGWVRTVGLVPAQVVFELDDLSEMRGVAAPRELMAPLTEAGFGLAVTCRGATSLTLDDLMCVGPDILKLPPAWVRGLGRSRVRRELVGGLTRLARTLDLVVIATGADAVEDVAALCELGVRYAQGALFGRPWALFAVPRPRGLSQLASIRSGLVPALGPRDDGYDDESGDIATAIRPVERPALSEGSQPAALLRDLGGPGDASLPLRELADEIDACFSGR
jgi:EAL domain-containing protein (putative c-di-GMP-specific phosphodiesterase class I)